MMLLLKPSLSLFLQDEQFLGFGSDDEAKGVNSPKSLAGKSNLLKSEPYSMGFALMEFRCG